MRAFRRRAATHAYADMHAGRRGPCMPGGGVSVRTVRRLCTWKLRGRSRCSSCFCHGWEKKHKQYSVLWIVLRLCELWSTDRTRTVGACCSPSYAGKVLFLRHVLHHFELFLIVHNLPGYMDVQKACMHANRLEDLWITFSII